MYNYNDDDVYRKAGIPAVRTNVIYARVSTAKQKKDLDNQVQSIIQHCNNNGIKIDKVFKDVSSGMNFDRKQFRDMMDYFSIRIITTSSYNFRLNKQLSTTLHL